MLDVNYQVEVSYNPNTVMHYRSKGYELRKFGDKAMVNVLDLTPGSGYKVRVVCDYCGQEYFPTYNNYQHHRINGKDCCEQCAKIKTKETCLEKYGVESAMKIDEVKNRAQTNTRHTMMKRYGVQTPTQVKEFLDKAVKHTQETCLKKYGVHCTCLLPEVLAKQKASYLQHGHCVTSKEQIILENLIQQLGYQIKPNYRVKQYVLDILLDVNDVQIDIEYDGWYWHHFPDVQEKDKIRDAFLHKNNIKILRIKSGGQMPPAEEIDRKIQKLINNNNIMYEEIIVSDWWIREEKNQKYINKA